MLLHIWKSIGSLLVKGNFYIRNITSTKRLLHEDVRHIGTSQPDMPYSFLYECRKLAPFAACQPTAHRLAWHATCRATDRQSGEKGQVSERCQSDRHLFLKESVGWGSCHIQGSLWSRASRGTRQVFEILFMAMAFYGFLSPTGLSAILVNKCFIYSSMAVAEPVHSKHSNTIQKLWPWRAYILTKMWSKVENAPKFFLLIINK